MSNIVKKDCLILGSLTLEIIEDAIEKYKNRKLTPNFKLYDIEFTKYMEELEDINDDN